MGKTGPEKPKGTGAPALPTLPADGYPRYDTVKLRLDPENPRLVEYYGKEGHRANQLDLLKILFVRMAVREVAMSVAYNGYFEHEPLILQADANGFFTTIEGNRRSAAVQLLLDGDKRKAVGATDLPDIDEINPKRREELQRLPGVVSTKEGMWRYLGFKHVNGPVTWGAYAKAQYIARVHNEYGVPLSQIALQIGDYSNTVERQFRGLMVIEQAEEHKLFDRANTSKGSFPFNYIYTALDNENFRGFLGLDEKRDQRHPVPSAKLKNLRDLLLWLYGDKSKGVKSVIRSQNPDLRNLGATISNEKGVKALRQGLPLDVAHDVSRGDEQIFRTSLFKSKESLQRAHATLTTGFDPADGDSLTLAIELEQLTRDLVDQMEQKKRRGQRPERARRDNV